MNCFTSCKRYFAESLNQPIHPVWLELKDKELQWEFDLKQAKLSNYRIKVIVVILWLIIVITALNHLRMYGLIIEHGSVLIVSLNVFLTICCIVGSYCPRLVKWFSVGVFVQRCVMIYVMLRMIDSEISQRTDKKILTDAINSLFIPWLVVTSFNPRIDFFILPLLFIANSATISASLDREHGSMNCFDEPEFYENGLL